MNQLALIIGLIIIILLLLKWVKVLQQQASELKHNIKSEYVLHGQAWEKFAPFMKDYNYEPEDFRFLGTPIDGVQFNDDSIVFVEFKTGESKLTGRERLIKKLIEDGKIRFEEYRY